MNRDTLTLGRLTLLAWLCVLSLLGVPLLFTGVPTPPLTGHLALLEAMTMKAPATTVAFDWTAGFVYTRLILAAVVVLTSIAIEWRLRKRPSLAGPVTAYYFIASSALLAYLTFGVLAILVMIVVI